MSTETEYEFSLIVDGVSVDDDEATVILAERFDAVVSTSRGVNRISISAVGPDAVGAFTGLVRDLGGALPRLQILRVDPDLVGVPDIAQRTGRTRQSVQQWVAGERNAGRSFPLPEGSAGRALVWRWAEVDQWLKPLGLDDGVAWPTRDESVQMDALLLQLRQAAGPPPVASPSEPAERDQTSAPMPVQATARRVIAGTAVLSAQETLIDRITQTTGTSLSEWFSRLEAGPAFLRREERAEWLADEHGIADRYAQAIVREYEIRRKLRLFGS